MSKHNVCCHKAGCFVEVPPERAEEECRRCWLDFLTDDKGLDLSYLKEMEEIKFDKKEFDLVEE